MGGEGVRFLLLHGLVWCCLEVFVFASVVPRVVFIVSGRDFDVLPSSFAFSCLV